MHGSTNIKFTTFLCMELKFTETVTPLSRSLLEDLPVAKLLPAYNKTQFLERPTPKVVVQHDRDFMELTYLSILPPLALSSKSLKSYWSQAYLYNAGVEWDRHGRRRRLPSVERRPSNVGIPGEGDVAGVGLHQEV